MAQRSIASFSLGFGMVNIPVKMYTAVGDPESPTKDIHQMHATCGTRIKMPKFCPVCQKQVDGAEIIKGYQVSKEAMVPITDEDMASLPLATAQAISIVKFVPEAVVADPRLADESYYIAPEDAGNAQRAFVLFMEGMKAAGVVGVAKLAVKSREHLCSVRAFDGVMLVQTLHWQTEIRDYHGLAINATVSEQEMALAKQLIGQMTGVVDLASFRDEYADALKVLVAAKKSGTPVTSLAPAAPKKQDDLLAALLASVNMAGTGSPEPAKT